MSRPEYGGNLVGPLGRALSRTCPRLPGLAGLLLGSADELGGQKEDEEKNQNEFGSHVAGLNFIFAKMCLELCLRF